MYDDVLESLPNIIYMFISIYLYLGGIMYDDVLESLPNAEKIVQLLTTNGKVIQVK